MTEVSGNNVNNISGQAITGSQSTETYPAMIERPVGVPVPAARKIGINNVELYRFFPFSGPDSVKPVNSTHVKFDTINGNTYQGQVGTLIVNGEIELVFVTHTRFDYKPQVILGRDVTRWCEIEPVTEVKINKPDQVDEVAAPVQTSYDLNSARKHNRTDVKQIRVTSAILWWCEKLQYAIAEVCNKQKLPFLDTNDIWDKTWPGPKCDVIHSTSKPPENYVYLSRRLCADLPYNKEITV